MPKFLKKDVFLNDSIQYDEILEKKQTDYIRQYSTAFFSNTMVKDEYSFNEHVWKRGDKLYKLAYDYYGDKDLWWIIALWNGQPTEADYSFGDIVQIPFPVDEILRKL